MLTQPDLPTLGKHVKDMNQPRNLETAVTLQSLNGTTFTEILSSWRNVITIIIACGTLFWKFSGMHHEAMQEIQLIKLTQEQQSTTLQKFEEKGHISEIEFIRAMEIHNQHPHQDSVSRHEFDLIREDIKDIKRAVESFNKK